MVDIVSIVCIGLGVLLIAIGFIGCVVPVLPGPSLAYCSLLLVRFGCAADVPSTWCLVLTGALTVAVTVLDYVVPALGARAFRCSRQGIAGCMLGTVVGLFFLPLGVMVGPFLGALVGELIGGKRLGSGLLGATGAFLGFVFGALLKLVCCGTIAYCFCQTVW